MLQVQDLTSAKPVVVILRSGLIDSLPLCSLIDIVFSFLSPHLPSPPSPSPALLAPPFTISPSFPLILWR